jgi:hypothetical protein
VQSYNTITTFKAYEKGKGISPSVRGSSNSLFWMARNNGRSLFYDEMMILELCDTSTVKMSMAEQGNNGNTVAASLASSTE